MNNTVCCHLESDIEKMDWLVIRIFGETELFDRDTEVMALQVAHAAKCGTAVEGIFENGLILGYFPGRIITYDDLRNSKISRYNNS